MIRIVSLVAVALLVTVPAPAAAQSPFVWPEKAENLQVMPEDTSASTLRAVMTGFSRTLGVRCNYCHVGEDDAPLSTYDLASDEKPTKETAREMLRMLESINGHLKNIEPSGSRVNMWCGTCHRGRPRPQTLLESLTEKYEADGIDRTMTHYAELRDLYYGHGAYDFGEAGLNAFGYRILEDDAPGAVTVFRTNATLFPDSPNTWDSLAEAYAKAGQTDEAIVCYEKVLEMDPENDHARQRLDTLRTGAAGGN